MSLFGSSLLSRFSGVVICRLDFETNILEHQEGHSSRLIEGLFPGINNTDQDQTLHVLQPRDLASLGLFLTCEGTAVIVTLLTEGCLCLKEIMRGELCPVTSHSCH